MADEWNVNTLKSHYDAILKEKFESLQRAVNLAEDYYKHKFDSTNEWRETVISMQSEYAKKMQVDLLKERLDKLEARKEGGNIAWAYVISIMGLIIAIVAMLK